MASLYETDVVAWARQQVVLLRSGQLSAIDALNIAEEIEDVGRSEPRELGSRVTVLVAHLLKWHFQPGMRTKSWHSTIIEQRRTVERKLRRTPSLKHLLDDPGWTADVWADAAAAARAETGLDIADTPIWTSSQLLDPHFFPD